MISKMTSKKKHDKREQILITIFVGILCVVVLIPFLLLVSISLSKEEDILFNGYKLIPQHLSLDAYKFVFSSPGKIFQAYKVTIFYSLISMVLSTLLMSMIAYPLTRKKLKGRRALSFYLYFTMLFSGGLVPSYILITQYLKLSNSILVYIIPSLINPWNIFMLRSFFSDLPESMIESVKIDGASEYRIFWSFILPLSKPVIATVALTTFLVKWNEWFTCMLYINDTELYSLQFLLQSIMDNIKLLQELDASGSGRLIDMAQIPSQTTRMVMAVVVAGPAVLVFPFFQKYFVKGLTVGSVKG